MESFIFSWGTFRRGLWMLQLTQPAFDPKVFRISYGRFFVHKISKEQKWGGCLGGKGQDFFFASQPTPKKIRNVMWRIY